MYGKRLLIPVGILIFAALACSAVPALPKIPEAVPVIRKDGECTDPRFKAAELAAYQALVKARADIANKLTNAITELEQTYQDDLNKQRDDYQTTLNACKDDHCTLGAKEDYDRFVGIAKGVHDGSLSNLEAKEAKAINRVQSVYDDAVENAREQFCSPGYQASGQTADSTYSGVICSLDQPFKVTVTNAFADYTLEFTPASASQGAFSFTWSAQSVTAAGSGKYTIEGYDTAAPRIAVTADSTGTMPKGTISKGGTVYIDLVPLTTGPCKKS